MTIRLSKRIALVVILVMIFVLAGLLLFIRFAGKDIVVTRLSAALANPVEVEGMYFSPPLGLVLKNVTIGNVGRVKEVKIGLGLTLFVELRNKVYVSVIRLKEPVFHLSRINEGRLKLGAIPAKDPIETNFQPSRPGEGKPSLRTKSMDVTVVIKKFFIENGQIQFRDIASDGREFNLKIKKINLAAQDISLPQWDMVTRFNMLASFPGLDPKKDGGKIEFSGWVDFNKRDMDAALKIIKLDGRIFSPYYNDKLNHDLKSVIVNMETKLNSKNNDMAVSSELKLRDIVFEAEGNPEDLSLEDLVLEGIQSLGKEIVFKFNFKTKMDDFRVGYIPFSGNILDRIKK